MLAAPWDPSSSFLFLPRSLRGDKLQQRVSSEAKFHKWCYKGTNYRQIHLLSIHHRSIVFCLIDCEPAGVHPARVRQTPGLTNESGGGGRETGNKLTNSHACHGAAFRVMVEWWTAGKEQQKKTTCTVRWSDGSSTQREQCSSTSIHDMSGHVSSIFQFRSFIYLYKQKVTSSDKNKHFPVKTYGICWCYLTFRSIVFRHIYSPFWICVSIRSAHLIKILSSRSISKCNTLII